MPTPRKHACGAQRQRAYRARCRLAREEELRAKNMPGHAAVPTIPGPARWKALLDKAREALTAVRQEMDAYRDQRSEAWQESAKGEEFQERLARIEQACDSVETID